MLLFTDMTKTEFRGQLERAWCAETAVNPDAWTPERPSTGQCALTALLLHDLMGGEIVRGEIDGGSHYWNRIGVLEVDLTRDQFDHWVEPAVVETRTREYLLSNANTARRYYDLKERYERADQRLFELEAADELKVMETLAEREEKMRAAQFDAKFPWAAGLRQLQKDCWTCSDEHGWHEDFEEPTGAVFIEKLALIHSELSEALEEYRDGHAFTETYFNDEKPDKPEGIPPELADVAIRLFDLAEIIGVDLAAAIAEKSTYNWTRPYRHGGKKA